MSIAYAGIGDCPDCSVRVLFAVVVGGDLLPLDEGQDGPVAVRWDSTDTPRARRVGPDYQPADGEHRFRLHQDSCAALARVIPLIPRTRQRPAPDTARRAAHAR